MKITKRITQLFSPSKHKKPTMFTHKSDNDLLTIDLYGVIGDFWNENEAEDLLLILNRNRSAKQIQLNVHSPGGFYSDGLSIMNQLKEHPAQVTATVQGMAWSMASLILMAADKVKVHENSWIMIHEAESGSEGRASDLQKESEVLNQINKNVAEAYASKTKLPLDKIQQMMADETWMDGQESVDLGFADELIPLKEAEKTASVQMKVSLSQPISFAVLDVYQNIPIQCLPTDKTATLIARINSTKNEQITKPTSKGLETPKMSDKTSQQTAQHIEKLKADIAVLQAAQTAQPTAEQTQAAQTILNSSPKQTSFTLEQITNGVQQYLSGMQPTEHPPKQPQNQKHASASEIAQLCMIANKPEMTAEFLSAEKTPDQVRVELAAIKQAELKAIPPINGQLGGETPTKSTKTMPEMAKESCEKQKLPGFNS